MQDLPDATTLFKVMDTTWPPRETTACGPFMLRDGGGGGKRVSAATCPGGQASRAEVEAAADAMRAVGEPALFGLRGGQEDLDNLLESMGFSVIDRVVIYAASAAALARLAPEGMVAIFADAPLAIQQEIWSQGGIGLERLAVMARAPSPKTHILARLEDRPAGVGFVGLHGDIAMLHALEVLPEMRRKGLGAAVSTSAAKWAVGQGARIFSLVTTVENTASNALYSGLGMTVCARYHYRILQEAS
ncbi:MAG: GNAT family N-acetyltransferase [Paracoccaceae bacterium]